MEEDYVVESIVRHKVTGGKIFYLVKWQGYADDENTWEPAENLEMIDLFEEYQKKAGLVPKHLHSHGHTRAKISEVIGLVNTSTVDNPVYVVRLQGEKKYTEMSSADIQFLDPTVLLEFLESCLCI